MLHRENLDDVYFNEISQRAISSISKYYPHWTDLNTHDPGVTLIELFAWLTEQQRFYMNQSEGAEPFFPLLGIKIRNVQAARTQIELLGGYPPRLIPKNTELYAESIRFETVEDMQYNGTPIIVDIIQRRTLKTPIKYGEVRGMPQESISVETGAETILDFALSVAGVTWTLTDDFRASRPYDKHYTLNRESGEVVFGDGLHGSLPYGEVLVTSLSLTRGANGNIAPHRITELCGIPVRQVSGAYGGAVRETANDAILRTFGSIRQAVTAEDIERLVLETPTVGVSCVRAMESVAIPQTGKPRLIIIAVKLKSGKLTAHDKIAIKRWLEPYRLVCREYKITDSKTAEVSLRLELLAGAHSPRFAERAERRLKTIFSEKYGGFGAVIRISEIRAAAADIPEVIDVKHCSFRVYGNARLSAEGSVITEPYAIAELSEVSIGITYR